MDSDPDRLDEALAGLARHFPRGLPFGIQELRQFLDGKDLRRSPWKQRAFRSLRRKAPKEPTARREWIGELMMVVWTAHEAQLRATQTRALVGGIAAAWPDRFARSRRRRALLNELGPMDRARAGRHLKRFWRRIEHQRESDGERFHYEIQNADLLRDHVPRIAADPAAEHLMDYLTRSIGLGGATAAEIAAKILGWLGRKREAPRGLRSWWLRFRAPGASVSPFP